MKKIKRIFFDNLKDFVDEIQLNVGGSNNNELSPLKNNKSENLFITKPKDDQLLKGENTGILRPMLQVKNIKIRSNNDENQNQLNTFIQNLYKRYIKKEKTMQSTDFKKDFMAYDIIHRTKLKNLQIINQKLFRKSKILQDNKVTRFAKSLNNELGRISNNFGKLDSVKNFAENPRSDFFFENTNEYLAYKSLKMKEDDKKLHLLPLQITKDPAIDKLSVGFYRLNKTLKEKFGKNKKDKE